MPARNQVEQAEQRELAEAERRLREEKRKVERAAAEKLLEEKKAEAEKNWIKERMNVEEAKVAVKQMMKQKQKQQQQTKATSSYVQKPRNQKEEQRLSDKYASMDLEERAFNILLDLGMISQSPDPTDPNYDSSSDDDFAAENIFK